MTRGERDLVCGGPFFFSEDSWLKDWLCRHESLMRGTDKCLYFPRWQFSVPRCNAHQAGRQMGKKMRFITRSPLRHVIGKVCLMGLYEMYVLAARADTALLRRKLARSRYARAKRQNRQLKKQYLCNQKEKSSSLADMKRAGQTRSGHLP